MALEWSSRPVAKAEIPRGTPWSYTLPLRDARASVQWHCRALPRSTWESDPGCPGRITVVVPDDLDILFGELTWLVSVEGAEPASGRIVFRVIEVRRESSSPATKATDLAAPESSAPPITQARPALPTPAGDAPTQQTAPSSRFIEVLRGGVIVNGLRAAVQPGRTLTIGRGPTLEDHDLNLAGRFESNEHETLLSRRHAEVFCNEEGVFIRNVGAHPIKLLDATGMPASDVQADHRWSVGEVIALPGKLRVVLREQ